MIFQEKTYRKKILSSVIATVLGSLCLSGNAAATVNYFELTIEQLLAAEVRSVSKKAETVANAAAAVYVITSEDILRSGVTSIPDALRMVPGVNVAQSDSNSWAISIRGFNSDLANKLLVLVDGRTIYNPVFGGVLWEAHDLLLEDIAQIEVVRGPGGALWGANAVNGVINITTKHTRDTQGNLLTALYGNEERGTVSTRYGDTFGDEGFYRVYAKGARHDSFKSPRAGDAYDAWDSFRTGFRADWNNRFTLQGDAYRTDAQQRRPNFSLRPPYMPIADQTIRYEGVNLLGRWADKQADGSQLSVQTYIDWAKRDEPFNFVDDRKIYDVETQYNLAPTTMHEIVVGAGYRFITDDKQGNRNVMFDPRRRKDELYSAFIQDKITLAPDTWFLTLGAKFEHNDFSGAETQPNARLQWQPTDKQTLWTSVARAVRTPTPIEEDVTSTIGTAANFRLAFVPNDQFKSEQLTAYELGYRNQMTPTIAADIAAFYNDYDHLQTITMRPYSLVINNIDPPHIFVPYQFTNDMRGTSDGIETVISWAVHHNLKIAANYSFLHMDLTAVDPREERAEELYPQHQAGLKILWNINHNWTLDTLVTYVDKLPGAAVADYTRLDINVGGHISKHVRINLVGQNLLEEAHREFNPATDLNAAEVERSLFAKVSMSF